MKNIVKLDNLSNFDLGLPLNDNPALYVVDMLNLKFLHQILIRYINWIYL